MRHRAGFTLIELSIVLVIIGLIAGGVLVGRDLIEAAAIRAQITQIERFKTAVQTFRSKYDGLPGDLNSTDATAFGFTQRGGGPGHGDGDGILEYCDGTVSTSAYLGCESALFWHDLSDAGLIEGSYTGTDSAVTVAAGQANNAYVPDAKVGVQTSVIAFSLPAPVLEVVSSGITPSYITCGVGSVCYAIAGMFPGTSGALGLTFSTITPLGLTPLEAFAIDSKIDDGLPLTGSVYGGNPTQGCAGTVCARALLVASTLIPANCVTWDTYPPTTILYAINTDLNAQTQQNNQPNVPSCVLNISGQ